MPVYIQHVNACWHVSHDAEIKSGLISVSFSTHHSACRHAEWRVMSYTNIYEPCDAAVTANQHSQMIKWCDATFCVTDGNMEYGLQDLNRICSKKRNLACFDVHSIQKRWKEESALGSCGGGSRLLRLYAYHLSEASSFATIVNWISLAW